MTDRLSNLDVLRALAEESAKGLVPTVRELGERLGVTGPAVQRHVNALVASGLVSRQALKSRSLALTPQGRSLLAS